MSKKKTKKKQRNNRTRSVDSSHLSQPANRIGADLDEAIEQPTSTFRLGPGQIGWVNFCFLLLCIAAQAWTIWISWEAWAHRSISDSPIPNLPWIAGTPQFSTRMLLMLSLGLAAISPKRFGLMIHLAILAIAIGMDQFRCQPQILSIALMMAACVWPTARRICIWYLIAMWTWAGIHKLLSPDWFGSVSYSLLGNFKNGLGSLGLKVDLLPSDHYKTFATIVAVSEIATGLLAWWRPKLGAIACVLLHCGISFFIFVLNWNYSVLPWNAATAIVGAWLLWNACRDSGETILKKTNADKSESDSWFKRVIKNGRVPLPARGWEKCVVIFLLLIPIGFYFGMVRHCFAHSLYSNNLPLAIITRTNECEFLESWDELKLPFPNAKKAYLDYFRETGDQGDRLQILDMMSGTSHFYRHDGAKKYQPISHDQFYSTQDNVLPSVGIDDPRLVFQLELAGANMLKRTEKDMVYAVSFNETYFQPEHLELLSGIPNLEEIQLQSCRLSDDDLDRIAVLPRLVGIGLSDTAITDAGIDHLKKQPNLQIIEHANTAITPAAVSKF